MTQTLANPDKHDNIPRRLPVTTEMAPKNHPMLACFNSYALYKHWLMGTFNTEGGGGGHLHTFVEGKNQKT